MKRLMEQHGATQIARTIACAVALSLSAAACTSSPVEEGAVDDVTATNPSALASGADPDDETDVLDGPDADDDADDDVIDGDDDVADVGPTTPQTIVPPGETAPQNDDAGDDDAGESTTTTAAPVDTVDPAEQPIQEQDTALVCATVEQGFIALLSGEDDTSVLGEGADLAVSSGVADYVDLGELLATAVSDDDGVQDAADALLSRCEADGFERLA